MKNKTLTLVTLFCLINLGYGSIFRTTYGHDQIGKLDQPSLDWDDEQVQTDLPVGSIQVHKVKGELADVLSDNLTSYTMYVTTNITCHSHMFGWFYQHPNKSAPVILWLQGGPGWSSSFGQFIENGPYFVYPNLTLGVREYAWTNSYSVLYIDSPVGTGYSFTDNRTECYVHNEDEVSRDLYRFLRSFFDYFDGLKDNDFFITGESYAGKYIPALASAIYADWDRASEFFSLKGIAIGDGWTDPINQLGHSSLLYQIGAIDETQYNAISSIESSVKQLIKDEKWDEADDLSGQILKLVIKYTGFQYFYNFLFTNDPDSTSWIDYLNLQSTRQQIGVGNITFSDSTAVAYNLKEDACQSVVDKLTHFLESGLPVLAYGGQLDIIVAPVLTESFLKVMDWPGADAFKKATKNVWRVESNDSEIAGYVKEALNLKFIVVRDAGHILPKDQPRVAFDMITRFVEGRSFID